MTSFYEPTTYNKRALENQWMNCTYNTHDLWCQCKDPVLHLLGIINRNSNAPKPEKDINNIKCLLTGITDTKDGEKEETGFDEGDLERIFTEDTVDDTG